MLLPRLTALLLAVNSIHAFKDSSPFFLLSSSPLSKDAPLQGRQIALTKDVEDQIIETLSDCDKKEYSIFTQENVHASDLKDGAMPNLQKRLLAAEDGVLVHIPEIVVMGELSADSVEKRLREACKAKGKKSGTPGNENFRISKMQLPALPSDEEGRAQALKEADDMMHDAVGHVLDIEHSSVLIYITTPPSPDLFVEGEGNLYEMDEPYPSALHTDLKRNLNAHKRQSDGENDMQAGLPLFEKYQFLSPGLFMGLAVSLLLFMILYVGISAISGLEVSYAAFSKDMGPQAQKGKQQ